MGTKIKDAILLTELTEDLMFAVGNTENDVDATSTSLKYVKEFIDEDKAAVAFTGSYLDLTDTPYLEDFVTINTLNTNYYNKNQINNIIGSISTVQFKIVEELPDYGESNVIYLIKHDPLSEDDIYDEYVWVEDGESFERIGSTAFDLSNYYTIDEVDALIPTVNNPTITFKQGQTTIGTITLNQSSSSTLTFSAIGTAQIPSDWDQTDTTAPDYIKNKPTIPTVNDPRITFTQGGVTIGAFTLNQSTADTLDLSDISQVQADWNERDDTSAAYILNKPSIPVVNNPTINFTQNGVNIGSITLNQSSGATIAISGGGQGGGVQSNWNEEDSTSMAYIQNKPGTRAFTVTYEDDSQETIEFYIKDTQTALPYLCITNTYEGSNTITLATSIEGGPSASLHSSTVEYSKDEGENWTTLNLVAGSSNTITLAEGERVYLRNDSGAWNYKDRDTSVYPYGSYWKTVITGSQNHTVSGNIMSLVDYTDMQNATMTQGCFYELFDDNSHLTDSSNLILPDTTTSYCYEQMFEGCYRMTGTVSTLPATTLSERCYSGMFLNTRITTAPTLPATTMATDCYNLMFDSCTALTTPPELPATNLARGCYAFMFEYCDFTTAPVLPALYLVQECYYAMFNGCSNLNSVTTYATYKPLTSCTYNWLEDVAATGTVHNLGTVTYDTDSSSGIPSGWTEVNN